MGNDKIIGFVVLPQLACLGCLPVRYIFTMYSGLPGYPVDSSKWYKGYNLEIKWISLQFLVTDFYKTVNEASRGTLIG